MSAPSVPLSCGQRSPRVLYVQELSLGRVCWWWGSGTNPPCSGAGGSPGSAALPSSAPSSARGLRGIHCRLNCFPRDVCFSVCFQGLFLVTFRKLDCGGLCLEWHGWSRGSTCLLKSVAAWGWPGALWPPGLELLSPAPLRSLTAPWSAEQPSAWPCIPGGLAALLSCPLLLWWTVCLLTAWCWGVCQLAFFIGLSSSQCSE